jgi:hypothetical protein
MLAGILVARRGTATTVRRGGRGHHTIIIDSGIF